MPKGECARDRYASCRRPWSVWGRWWVWWEIGQPRSKACLWPQHWF